MTEQTWIELIKWLGLPITMFMFILWTGYRQVWHWHRELEAVIRENGELREDRDYWRDQRMSTLTDLERRAADRDYRTIVREREARE